MVSPKKKKVFGKDFLEKKKEELKKAQKKAKESGLVPIGFALESAEKNETVEIMMSAGGLSETAGFFENGSNHLIAAGDLVGLDSKGHVVPFESEHLPHDEDDEEEEKFGYGVVEIEDDFIREILQTISSDLLGKDIEKFRLDRTKKVWEVVVKSNRSTHADIRGLLPVISRIHGSRTHRITPEGSFRRNRKVKKAVSKGKAVGLKVNARKTDFV